MIQEFKKFAMRGNVIDLAVGIIIGAAFTGIVTSLVNDIIMPLLGVILGGLDFKDYFITLRGPVEPTLEAAGKAGAATWNYGQFITRVVNFLIVAFAIFLLVRQINRLSEPPAETPEPPPTRDQILLTEIRDLLKARDAA